MLLHCVHTSKLLIKELPHLLQDVRQQVAGTNSDTSFRLWLSSDLSADLPVTAILSTTKLVMDSPVVRVGGLDPSPGHMTCHMQNTHPSNNQETHPFTNVLKFRLLSICTRRGSTSLKGNVPRMHNMLESPHLSTEIDHLAFYILECSVVIAAYRLDVCVCSSLCMSACLHASSSSCIYSSSHIVQYMYAPTLNSLTPHLSHSSPQHLCLSPQLLRSSPQHPQTSPQHPQTSPL